MSDLTRVAIDAPQPAAEPLGVRVGTGITVQPMNGAGGSSGVRYCVVCLAEFRAGETWLQIAPPDGSYTIGIHIHCYHAGS